MKWLRRFIALLLACVALVLPLVIAGALIGDWKGMGIMALGFFLAPAGLAGGVLVGGPGFLWLDRARPKSIWPGLLIGTLTGVVALAATIASMDELRNLGWVPDLSPPLLALFGSAVGLLGTVVFWGSERMLEYVFNTKPYPQQG
jgi:hypothetical protein